jgi:Mg2+-importing ATPase
VSAPTVRTAPIGPPAPAFWDEPLAELLDRLAATPDGLTAAEARRRLGRYGRNEVGRPRAVPAVLELVGLLLNPLVLVLLVAGAISAAFGEVVNFGLIAAIVAISVVLDFVQSYRSRQAAEQLRRSVAVTATVLRDGAPRELPLAEVVPGDVVQLGAGDLVPADCRLLAGRDLSVNQAALTGESLPAAKEPGEPPGAARALDDATNALFLGTSVMSGTGRALVVATGPATVFGHVAAHLASRPPETEFERGSRRFGMLIMRTVVFLVLFVFLVNAALHRPLLESFLFAVALAVGLTPEFLPMIVAVTLARGAVRMARRRVVVKHLAAIENFGSMDVLCTDKTGTLTVGEMRLDAALDPSGRPSERVLRLAALNSRLQTGLRSPLDTAVLAAAPADLGACEKVDEVPFDFERRRLSVVLADGEGRLLVCKGTPESVLPICASVEAEGGERPLDEAQRGAAGALFERLSGEGKRVLAVAARPVPVQPSYGIGDEHDACLVGFLAFVDPSGPDVAGALAALRDDGVAVKILSGDNDLVCRHLAGQVGLGGADVVTGVDVARLDDAALGAVAERTSVFARVSPEQKNRIILALKRRGHVVGYLGDGINDAPSLHSADVGISVPNAVDVAREAAEIILLERSLRVLHDGVVEGRRSFANITKYLMMGTSSNFGNMFSMAGASLFLPFLPMLPVQILANNLIYDCAQLTIPGDRVEPADLRRPRHWNVDAIRRFMVLIGPISSVYDFLTFWLLLAVFGASAELFRTGWFVESLATQVLVIFVIRTSGNPLRNPPSRALAASALGAVALGVLLPFTPLGALLGFVPPPPLFFAVLVVLVATYLALVQVVKSWFYRRYPPGGLGPPARGP